MTTWIGAAVLAAVALYGASCVRASDGTWYVREAPLPEGWPVLTPVGEVRVTEYPEARAAVVREADLDAGGMEPMFMTLFGHIKDRGIAMTTPVDMGYDRADDDAAPRMTSMAFLYRRPTQGTSDDDGPVAVEDLEPRTYASLGVRGGYSDARFAESLATLDAWLAARADEWTPDGPPRYLGYNGPFTPPPMKYGEVQVPVRPAR